jgi:hypothetical protein
MPTVGQPLPPTLRAPLDEWITDGLANGTCSQSFPTQEAHRADATLTPTLRRQYYVFVRRRFGLSLTRHRRELTTIIDAMRGVGAESSMGSILADGDTEYQSWAPSPHARHVYAHLDGEHRDPDVWGWLTTRQPDNDGKFLVPTELRALINLYGCTCLRQLDYLLYSQELVPD